MALYNIKHGEAKRKRRRRRRRRRPAGDLNPYNTTIASIYVLKMMDEEDAMKDMSSTYESSVVGSNDRGGGGGAPLLFLSRLATWVTIYVTARDRWWANRPLH